MGHPITILPQKLHISAQTGDNLLQVLRRAGVAPDAPCSGSGTCGKCRVLLDGEVVSACQVTITDSCTVTLPPPVAQQLLTGGIAVQQVYSPVQPGHLLAFDIGTTTVAGYLLESKTGKQLVAVSAPNPQSAFGADVISRIRHGLQGQLPALTGCIRSCVAEMTEALCEKAGITPESIGVVSVVGNPAMQQLFLGISPENLAQIPFAPVLTEASYAEAVQYLPCCKNATLLIVPDISGFIGADTLACILATGLHTQEELCLLVDIGTNGEMVLGNCHRMIACSAAAGPALEGANIRFGMRGQTGAIDHVWQENGVFRHHVIGEGKAAGICGSGLIDAVAAALDMGLINYRGNLQAGTDRIMLSDTVYLTQEDIRQVQLAKGAIAAGIELMAAQFGIHLEDVQKVFLAGAFGTYMDPAAACRIGLLPPVLSDRITAVGNAAGSGAKLLACNEEVFSNTQQLRKNITFLELATLPAFRRCFAKHMRF